MRQAIRSPRAMSLVLGAALAFFILPMARANALNSDEQKCINTLNKNVQKVSAAYGKALSFCMKDYAKGVSQQSDMAACMQADTKGKIGKSTQKALDGESSQCDTLPTTLASSAFENNLTVLSKELDTIEILFGSDVPILTGANKGAAKCQGKIVKDVLKCQGSKLKEFNKCAKGALKAAGGVADVEACLTGLSSNDKVAKACDKILLDITKKCSGKGVDLTVAFPHCNSNDDETVADCLEIPLECGVCQALNTVARLNTDCDRFDDGTPNASCAFGSFLALSYNVAGLPDPLSDSTPSIFTPIISPLLNRYDLVLVQESWKTPDPNPLAPLRVYHELLVADAHHPYKSEPAPLPVGNDPNRPNALVSDGLNRFSQFPFDPVVREAWTSCFGVSDNGADCLAFKGFSVARTTLAAGAMVDIYNLHMEAGNAPEDVQVRDESVTQLSAFLNAFSIGEAVIMGGDFNLNSDTEPAASQFQTLLSNTGLTDVCAFLACPEPGRIDKFLFRSSDTLTLTPTSWNFETDVFATDDGQPLSDHDALAVRFDWAVTPPAP